MNRTWSAFVVGTGVFLIGSTPTRIPIFTIKHGWKGYLEDRRPASNADRYRVTSCILRTYAAAQQKTIA